MGIQLARLKDKDVGRWNPYPLEKKNHAMEEMARAPTAGCMKVFIQRDYQEGTNVKFQSKFPPELEDKIDKSSFELLINKLNAYYVEAEKISSKTYCEGFLACFTAYLVYLCMETHYEKCLKRIASFIQEQNDTVWLPRGLLVVDPIERGLRVIEIAILNEPATVRS